MSLCCCAAAAGQWQYVASSQRQRVTYQNTDFPASPTRFAFAMFAGTASGRAITVNCKVASLLPRYPHHAMTRKQSGFTLLEIMVAIVVLSSLAWASGLAGAVCAITRLPIIAASPPAGLRHRDRLRANLAGVRAGNYSNLAQASRRQSQLFYWGLLGRKHGHFRPSSMEHGQAALLPNGNGTVVCVDGLQQQGVTAATGNWVFNITVSWTERTGSRSGTQSFVTSITP